MPCKKEVAFAISELGQLPPGRCNLKALYGSERHRPRRLEDAAVHDDVPAVQRVRQRSERSRQCELLPWGHSDRSTVALASARFLDQDRSDTRTV